MAGFPREAETSGRRDLVFGLDVDLFAALFLKKRTILSLINHIISEHMMWVLGRTEWQRGSCLSS